MTEIARLQVLVGERPSDHESLTKLANQQWVVGDYDNAQRSFARALEMSRARDTAVQLAGLLYKRGRFVEAASVSKQFGLTNGDAADLQWLRDFIALYDVSSRSGPVATVSPKHNPQAELRNSIEMILVPVPGGRFDRGCDACEPDARPVRSITVAPLLFGRYEVTVAQYKLFMRETGYRRNVQTEGFDQTPDDHPAYGISWYDARAFTIWLSAREQAVYRLPTEAEWEFAARGGVGNREPWGMEPGQPQVDGNWGRTNPDDLRRRPPPTSPVASFPKDRSAFGLFDMAGNVREWCLDDYDASYYTWSPERNPFGPVTDTGVNVLRGGAWNHPPGGSEFALLRSRAAANQSYTGYGLRVVREVSETTKVQGERGLAGQSRESAQKWVRENYLAVVDRALPLGDWTSDSATEGAAWRVGFRARGDGPEWLIVLVGRDDSTTANVMVAESPIEEQLLALYIHRKGKLASVDAKVNIRRWQLAGKGCEAVERAVEWILHQGVRLAQPSEFAMDGPTYDIRAEAINRQVLVSSQGLGADAQIVAVMRAVRNAAETAQCTRK